jgi:predicted metal-dependent hydrolase
MLIRSALAAGHFDRNKHTLIYRKGHQSEFAGQDMKKADRMTELIAGLVGRSVEEALWPPAYEAFFVCFNRQEYYEAHDVLEHLWLQTTGPEHAFFKGLIQMAGAFVHLRKHYLRPHHHKDARRLAPAARLFALALHNWQNLPEKYFGLDVREVRNLCCVQIEILEAWEFRRNPWRPETAPKLGLQYQDHHSFTQTDPDRC